MLKEYLYADLSRQLVLEGRLETRSTLLVLLGRLLHPRFLPLVLCRCARAALLHRIPLLPRLLTYCNIVLFGLEVSPRCNIGPGFFLPHTIGTVIGAAEIGRNATIFQGVTLGAKRLDMDFNVGLRPTVGNDVTIGSGAKVLGGIRIGDFVTIGANSVVINDVGPHLTVSGIPSLSRSEHP